MPPVQVSPLPSGPYRITGELQLVDADGRPVPAPEPPIHLCRCGRSATKP